MANDDPDTIRRDFDRHVNMTAKQLEAWLQTDESKAAGQKDGGGESVGHESGRRIVAILGKRKDDLTDGDVAHMRKVVGYIERHLAQRPDKPKDELEGMAWTHSLRNWGHDPLAS
jgi:hypothetical protein